MTAERRPGAPEKVALEEMSWREVAAALERGVDTVIVMVGSIEQHGPHLPLSTDTLIADELARRVARKLGDALAAPSIRPGCSEHHLGFPGTISLRPLVLLEILRDYCRALARHGFHKVVLASSHGGNFAPLEAFAPELVREFPQLRIVHYGDLRGYMAAWHAEVNRLGLAPEKARGHAGIAETSQVLRLRPETVRVDLMEPGFTGSIQGLESRVLRDGIQVVTANGILGDPRGADPEIGEAFLEGMAAHLAEWARQELAGAELPGEGSGEG